jgi:CheY-like chemotaxis protein
LPGRSNGLELVAAVRQRCGAEVPAVVLTGDTDPDLLAQAHHAGLVLLHKPFKVEALRAVVERQLAGVAG